uniref:Uncharacterized protein n=1 Tax=Nelumbo nucifera TaxID=4432 RepID=A0A822ZLU2_NELNU|nr:TPA_asm: hypothetical protein HUJ06_002721 [Nelumbo nucifera]
MNSFRGKISENLFYLEPLKYLDISNYLLFGPLRDSHQMLPQSRFKRVLGNTSSISHSSQPC